jgi:hypothetical protein
MVDFRKLLLALIAGALMFGIAASAADFSCQVSGVPTLIRSESVADYVGDVLMDCAGTLPPIAVTNGMIANIRMSFLGQNVIITSKLLENNSTRKVSEATLILDNAVWPGGQRHPKGYVSTSPVLQPFSDGSQNVYQALQLNDQELEWQGVMLNGPGSNISEISIRMTNVRVNAQALSINAPINAQLNIVTAPSIPIFGNTSVLVANIRQGLFVSHLGALAKNCDLNPNGSLSFSTTFTEGFGTAFKPRLNNFNQSGYPPATGHFVPGGGYFDESGYNPVGFTDGVGGQINGGVLDVSSQLVGLPSIGLATQGTELSITVTGVPNGLTLSFGAITTSNNLQVMQGTVSGSPVAVQGPLTGGVWILTVEVTGYGGTGDAQFLQDWIKVPVIASFGAPPVVGVANAHGRFVPDAGGKFHAELDSVAPLPRFVDSTSAYDAKVIEITQSCKTLLLFPYVTGSSGFATGIAISNTSHDPFGMLTTPPYPAGTIGYPPTIGQVAGYAPTKEQHGACTLYFYGQSAPVQTIPGVLPQGSLTMAQHAQTSLDIPAGGQLVLNVPAGLVDGTIYDRVTPANNKKPAVDTSIVGNTGAPLPGFVGYMFASCNFQWAHGYAFITEYDGLGDRTNGYIALVVPDRGFGGRLPQESSFQAAPNQAEQLGQ